MSLATAAASGNLEAARAALRGGEQPNATVLWNAPGIAAEGAAAPASTSTSQSDKSSPSTDSYNALPLHLAVIAGKTSVVKLLLEAGAEVHRKDGRGRSALICAIYGCFDTLDIASINYKDLTESRPEHLVIAQILLQQLLSVDPTRQIFDQVVNQPQTGISLRGITPLCLAAYLGKASMVKVLLDGGAAVDACDKNGATALMYAARDGHVEATKDLLAYGAAIDIKDGNGWTAVKYAHAYPDIKRLLEKSRLKNLGSKEVLPGTLFAELSRKYPSFPAAFASFIASWPLPPSLPDASIPSSANASGAQTPLEQTPGGSPHFPPNQHSLISALRQQDLHALQLVLHTSTTEQINQADPTNGLTPLLYAVRARPIRHPETETIVRILIAVGAEINAANNRSGKTALHYLSREPYRGSGTTEEPKPTTEQKIAVLAIARFLLSQGAGVDVADFDGNRPLHLSARFGEVGLVRIFLQEAGADPTVLNRKGKRPSDMTVDQECLDLLQGACAATSSSKGQEQAHPAVSSMVNIGDSNKPNNPGSSQPNSAPSKPSALSNSSSMSSLDLTASKNEEPRPSAPTRDTSLRQLTSKVESMIRNLQKSGKSVTQDTVNPVMESVLELLTAHKKRTLELQGLVSDLQASRDGKDIAYRAHVNSLENSLSVERTKSAKVAMELESVRKAYATSQAREKAALEQQNLTQAAYEKALARAAQMSEQVEKQKRRIEKLESARDSSGGSQKGWELESNESSSSSLPRSATAGNANGHEPPTPKRSDKPHVRIQLAELDLHLDILRANMEAVNSDLQDAEVTLQQVRNKRKKLLIKDASDNIQPILNDLNRDEHLLLAETRRLKNDREDIQKRLSEIRQRRNMLWETAGRAALQAAGRSDVDHLASTIYAPDRDGKKVPSVPGTGFVTLEGLLQQFQLASQTGTETASGSHAPNAKRRQSLIRLSTVYDGSEVDVDLDSALLSRLLYAAKQRIHKLKTSQTALQSTNANLQQRLDSQEDTLLALQNRFSEEEEALKQALEKRGEIAAELKEAIASAENLAQQRKKDVEQVRKLIVLFLGQRCVSGDQESLNSTEDDQKRSEEDNVGLLGRMQRLISELDPTVMSRLPAAYATEPGTIDETMRLSASSSVSSLDLSGSVVSDISEKHADLQRKAERALSVLTLAASRFKAYFGLIRDVLLDMKQENQKFVREILLLKRGGSAVSESNKNVDTQPGLLKPTRDQKVNVPSNLVIPRAAEDNHSPSSFSKAPSSSSRSPQSHTSPKSIPSSSGGPPLSATPSLEMLLLSIKQARQDLAALDKVPATDSHSPSVDASSIDDTSVVAERKRKEYLDLIKSLMRVMRDNNEDLTAAIPGGSGEDVIPWLSTTRDAEPSEADYNIFRSGEGKTSPSIPQPPKRREEPNGSIGKVDGSRPPTAPLPTLVEEYEGDTSTSLKSSSNQAHGLLATQSSLLDRLRQVNYEVTDMKNSMRERRT